MCWLVSCLFWWLVGWLVGGWLGWLVLWLVDGALIGCSVGLGLPGVWTIGQSTR